MSQAASDDGQDWAHGVEPGARVVVAMSGGVDSSVAAALLAARGYDVVGVSMRLASGGSVGHASAGSSGCCSLADFMDAGRVADRLGIAHYTFDMRKAFTRSVVEPFVDEYLAGRTPSPCIVCNREIKFGALRRKAAELGATHVASGHYARRVRTGGRYQLRAGRDASKDQSYFLFEMGQAELSTTLFPVGDLRKDEVRREAERLGLAVATKPDSQEICFVPDGRYAEIVERIAAERVRPGRLVDEQGRELGAHGGVHRFTIGQRRGIGIAAPSALYVCEIDSTTARVTVTTRERLGRTGLEAAGVVWTSGTAEPDGARVDVRIRYRHRAVAATLERIGADRVRVLFDIPQDGVSPGQAAVFYRYDEVVGGGWITRALPAGGCREREAGEEERCA